MKYLTVIALTLILAFSSSCKRETAKADVKYAIDSTAFESFFKKYPDFKPYQKQIADLYRLHKYEYIWYSQSDGRSALADVLFDRARQIQVEGVDKPLPYRDTIQEIIETESDKPDAEHDFLFSGMYFFYAKNVFEGLDPQTSKKLGWYLPRQKSTYDDYLLQLMDDPEKIDEGPSDQTELYQNLKKALSTYREIAKKGGWGTIDLQGKKVLKKDDKGVAVAMLKKRLAMTGEYSGDTSDVFDDSLEKAVRDSQARYGFTINGTVDADLVKALNVPVSDRIRTLVVNMERARWLSPEMTDGKEYIAVNIPSFRMRYVRDGDVKLESNVVVGKSANRTVVFSGMMSYIVFSPYWNVPKSIIEKEIKPGMDADPDYLEKHDMEWNDGNVRQRPGPKNSLGLVKFMFPNQNNIYLHDSPAKSLFTKEERAFSHGCVRVQKARELAQEILKGDKKWNASKIDQAMKAGKEQHYTLDRKIPVYIAYFTAIADKDGRVAFFDDVYGRDARLARLLYN
jgi:murein L,D-transpeptidase YcbB/YkuD